MTITPFEIDRINRDRFMLKPEVQRITGLSNTTLWREVKAERFPSPFQLSPHRIGWLESSVREWMQGRRKLTYRDTEAA